MCKLFLCPPTSPLSFSFLVISAVSTVGSAESQFWAGAQQPVWTPHRASEEFRNPPYGLSALCIPWMPREV